MIHPSRAATNNSSSSSRLGRREKDLQVVVVVVFQSNSCLGREPHGPLWLSVRENRRGLGTTTCIMDFVSFSLYREQAHSFSFVVDFFSPLFRVSLRFHKFFFARPTRAPIKIGTDFGLAAPNQIMSTTLSYKYTYQYPWPCCGFFFLFLFFLAQSRTRHLVTPVRAF